MFDYEAFAKWLDTALELGFPENTVAINFNLYEEHAKDTWAVQLIGADRFDAEDEAWACYETFTTGENLYRWVEENGWETVLETAKAHVREYLNTGQYASVLKRYAAVGIGFVDGDLALLYERENET